MSGYKNIERGWNTWNPRSLGAIEHRPSGFSIELFFQHAATDDALERVSLKDVGYFGGHAMDGSYFALRVEKGAIAATIEAGADADVLALRVAPSEETRVGVRVSGKGGQFRVRLFCGNVAKPLGESAEVQWISGAEAVEITACPVGFSTEPVVAETIAKAKSRFNQLRVRGTGLLEGSVEGMQDVIPWNTLWHRPSNRTVIPETREFYALAEMWGGYLMGCWDSFFQAIYGAPLGFEACKVNIRMMLEEMTKEGFVPNGGTGKGPSNDRSQPPVGALAAWKTYLTFGDRSVLEDFYEPLVRWHQWWFTRRDGNDNGLLEWGSHVFEGIEEDSFVLACVEIFSQFSKTKPEPKTLVGNLATAGLESGMDNSQMWDGVPFNAEKYVMELDAVDLNCFYALDAWCLGKIAGELGKESESKAFMAEYEEMGKRINDHLWDEKQQLYANRLWDGTFSTRMSPTCFYPMLAGIAPQERAEVMVEKWLLNEEKYWHDYLISTTPLDDPAMNDNVYWRGRIWGCVNYLVYEGLKRYGFDEVAAEFAKRSLDTFKVEFDKNGHQHENYNGLNAVGCDVPSSNPYYTWGAFLPYVAMQECIDYEFWSGGLRVGSLGEWPAGVRNLVYGGHSYGIEIGGQLVVRRDGQEIVHANQPIILRNLKLTRDGMSFEAEAKDKASLEVSGLPANAAFTLTTDDGTPKEVTADASGELNVAIIGRQKIVIER